MMRTDAKINAKLNIGLFIFLLVTAFYSTCSEVLFEEKETLDKITVIDIVLEHSRVIGVLVILGMIITWVILLLISALFVRVIWNRLLVEVVNNIKPINFQEALTISLLLAFLYELITFL